MSRARDRQKKRKQQRDMVRRSDRTTRQIAPEGSRERQPIQIPGGRWAFLIPLGVVLLVGVVYVLGLINPPEVETAPNAIWLDSSWSYRPERSDEEFEAYVTALQENQIGHVFLYVSSLKLDGAWSGFLDGRNRFSEVEDIIVDAVQRFHKAAPNIKVYAWIEVATTTPNGYRLDGASVHNAVASFSSRMVFDNGFDGVLLDVKPVFEENEDLLILIRTVRANIDLDVPLLVSVPPDLTPSGTDLNLPSVIAMGTEWGIEFKQRVALQADGVVIAAYNSYHTNPVDYIEWVSYQVAAYVEALSQVDTGAKIYIGVPNYEEKLPAHDVGIESLAGALDGVRRAVQLLEPELERPLFSGVAIYSDHDLSAGEWLIFTGKWLNSE